MNKFANEALKDKHIAIKTGAGSLGACFTAYFNYAN